MSSSPCIGQFPGYLRLPAPADRVRCFRRRTTTECLNANWFLTFADPEHPAGPSGRRDRGATDQALRLVRRAEADGLLQADEGCAQGRSAICRLLGILVDDEGIDTRLVQPVFVGAGRLVLPIGQRDDIRLQRRSFFDRERGRMVILPSRDGCCETGEPWGTGWSERCSDRPFLSTGTSIRPKSDGAAITAFVKEVSASRKNICIVSYSFVRLDMQVHRRGRNMRRLGIHSFVWTGGQTQQGLELALEKSAEHGYRAIEFAYLRPQLFDLDRLAKRAQSLDIAIGVTMGLPRDCDVSSTDAECVARGRKMLSDAVTAVRDIGGDKLGGILYSAHTKYDRQPTADGWRNSTEVLNCIGEEARKAGIDVVLEVVNRFETNLLNTTAQGLKYLADADCDALSLHLDTFHMNIEEANPAGAIRLAGDRLGYFHIGESNRGYLGDGVINFDLIFDALLDIGYSKDIVFESFSTAIVDEGLSLACAIWRDTWSENDPLAAHARQFIEMKRAEATRRRITNESP